MKIDGGATIWARQTIDSEIFYNKPDKWFKIWFYIVNTVNYKDNKRAKRGGCFLKYDWIMNATGANKNQVKHCVAFLKANSMLATRKATRGFNVEVVKYKEFQNLNNYKSHTERNTKGTQKEHKSHTILKKVKKVKNVKNRTTIISQIEILISQFPQKIRPLIKEYTDIARLQNKTERISPQKELRLTNELHLVWSRCNGDIDEADFRQALKTTVSSEAPNINYVRKVIQSIIRKRSVRLKRGAG
tara:strand:+ start:99 stop:833 length:735 start_codon:yes stop_codon:yes gene_type:complete